ncbi:hypothetical protein MNBD_GAMMA12-806 [hydrothermal vent metagenome]|uniref:Uncharacterized protein n=1 Tax=hydrothermal vent metagenome TaxID=652676 RepID=A0A3B0ZKQ7_9ZZZZ
MIDAIISTKKLIFEVLGRKKIIISGNMLMLTNRVFGISFIKNYILINIDSFISEDENLFFRYGKDRIMISTLTKN